MPWRSNPGNSSPVTVQLGCEGCAVQSGRTVTGLSLVFLSLGSQEGDFEMINKIEIERFSLTSSKPFDQVVEAVNAGIGHPDIAEFFRSTHEAHSFAELNSAVVKGLS